MFVASILGSLVLCVQVAVALRPNGRLNRATPIAPIPEEALSEGPVVSRNGTQLPPYNTTYIFNQLIDHTNPSLGTFQQRYWHTYEWYETGPIILNTPGEANAQPYTGYLTNATINGQIAQQQSGATIVLEHRFYGLSNPVPNLSGKNLKLHTIQQAIDDLAYFAENVVLPMPNGAHLSPADAPWILIGGSYSGALTSWTLVNKPDVFWAGYASSAVVEAILDYWGYFEPIRQFMPANCSADVEAVIAHVDEVFSGNDATAIQVLKDNWGLGEMTHLDDVAGCMFRNNLWDWQSLSPTSGPGATFFQFCDALEVKDGVNAPATGWGLDHALTAWGSFWNETYLDALCGGDDVVDCLGSYNPESAVYTDIALDNAGRSWTWIVCNEVGFLQEGPPEGVPAVVTRLVQPAYDIRQCVLMFSDVFASPADVPMAAGVANVNKQYTGWNVSVDRLFFANGQRDPWREATVSADGVDVASTNTQPIAIGDGFHCSDLLTSAGTVDKTVRAVQTEALSFMKTWLAEWEPPSKTSKREISEARHSRFFKNVAA
ncbi:serine carboxypeptidase S28-domain-containing protein [Lentinula edodes]|uniref:Serine carboxypeptidase S28-domain-containing protein n=1 Tax=Lentinula lateritia TaxID=40482 RepID=A0A9W9AXW7_9AGAR|nr:serine carboxypeptidase S28-domain-containing protein [Lentinula edodes]KAJ4492207.1 serine carboxypeptidase S28-domain-containing protein [Lentinula edodes]